MYKLIKGLAALIHTMKFTKCCTCLQLSERKAQRSGWKADGHQQPEVEDANAAGASKRGRRD